ncbi:MAG: energy-coupling factor transporter transmembrane component T [Nitrososphaerota archaeon]
MLGKIALDLDSRTKILLFITWFSMVFICRNLYSLLTLFASSTLILILSGSAFSVFKKMKIMLPLVLLSWPLWTFLGNWSLFHSTGGGFDLFFGLFMMLRLLLIIMISVALILIVKPTEIIGTINSVKLPPQVGAVFALAFRNLYITAEDYKSIKEAHTSRGLELDKGSLVKRIRSHIPLLIPLIIKSIDNAEKLVLALELRPSIMNRRKSKPLRLQDTVMIIGCVIVLLFMAYYSFVMVS